MRSPFIQRLSACLLLMAYAITGTSLVPAVIAVAAGMEGSHAVQVAESAHGIRVTLHHTQASGYTPCIEDHTTTVARLLVSFSNRSEGGDHQITTTESSASVSMEGQGRTLKVRKAEQPAIACPSPLPGARESRCWSRDESRVDGAPLTSLAVLQRIRTVQMLM